MKVATTRDYTVWHCDNCETFASSPTAFDLPPGWWEAHITRKTESGRSKAGTIDACSKDCLTNAITFSNQSLIDYT